MAQPQGLLILHHGRGSDEHDLLTLADVLDPQRRLHVVTPRAPLAAARLSRLPLVPGAARGLPRPGQLRRGPPPLGELHDELWRDDGCRHLSGPSSAGFSMGAVMSYALAFSASASRTRRACSRSPASSPSVEGWQPDLAQRQARAACSSRTARRDQVISVDFARAAGRAAARGGPSRRVPRVRGGTSHRPRGNSRRQACG